MLVQRELPNFLTRLEFKNYFKENMFPQCIEFRVLQPQNQLFRQFKGTASKSVSRVPQSSLGILRRYYSYGSIGFHITQNAS